MKPGEQNSEHMRNSFVLFKGVTHRLHCYTAGLHSLQSHCCNINLFHPEHKSHPNAVQWSAFETNKCRGSEGNIREDDQEFAQRLFFKELLKEVIMCKDNLHSLVFPLMKDTNGRDL